MKDRKLIFVLLAAGVAVWFLTRNKKTIAKAASSGALAFTEDPRENLTASALGGILAALGVKQNPANKTAGSSPVSIKASGDATGLINGVFGLITAGVGALARGIGSIFSGRKTGPHSTEADYKAVLDSAATEASGAQVSADEADYFAQNFGGGDGSGGFQFSTQDDYARALDLASSDGGEQYNYESDYGDER